MRFYEHDGKRLLVVKPPAATGKLEEDIDDIPYGDPTKYMWPPAEKGGEQYPHLTKYKLFDIKTENYVNLFESGKPFRRDKEEDTICAVGTFIPPPNSKLPEKRTQFVVRGFAIDFGSDSDRGFWLMDVYDVWYKLEVPDDTYAVNSEKALRIAGEYIKLMDYLNNTKIRGVPYLRFFRQKSEFECKKSIEFIYEESNHIFDLSCLMEIEGLLYNLLLDINCRDCALLQSCLPVCPRICLLVLSVM